MKVCKYCETENQSDVTCCTNCGASEFKNKCANCGIVFEGNFCPQCGTKAGKAQKTCPECGESYTSYACPSCGYTPGKKKPETVVQYVPVESKPQKTIIVKQKKRSGCLTLILVMLAISFLSAICSRSSSTGSSAETTDNFIWSRTYTDLSCFDYYIEGETIVLKDYNGSSRKVNIAEKYTVDGIEYTVVALEGTFVLKRVDSVIVPETVTWIVHNTFNSCGIDYLYLPSSLENFTGWNYFHEAKAIYYGGTEAEWKQLYTGERSELDVMRIVYGADISKLTAMPTSTP